MRILHIIASADPADGGPIEGILQLGAQLDRGGHRQELLTLDPPDAAYLRDQPMTVHAKGARRRLGRLGRWARISPAAMHWAREHVGDYDVAIVHGLWNFATMAARWSLVGSGTPFMVYAHGTLDPWFRRRYPAKHAAKQALWLVNEGVLLRRADAVLFTCEEERSRARRSFRPYRARERVVRHGTADALPYDPAQRQAFAATVPALGDRPYLLFLGRLHEKKGCDLLIEAFARIASRHPAIDLVIAGPDREGLRATLVAQAARAGIAPRLHWPAMLTGAAKWGAFHGCTAFVLPSHQENFGIVIAEAMACARPVLISDRVNIWREVAAAKAGLVEPDTITGTTALLDRFLALSPAERASEGGRRSSTGSRRTPRRRICWACYKRSSLAEWDNIAVLQEPFWLVAVPLNQEERRTMTSNSLPIVAPATYVPLHGVAFGALGDMSVAVDPAHPLPVADRSYSGAVALAPDVQQAPGRALLIDCSRAGRVTLVLADASQLSVPVATGLSILPFAVAIVLSTGMTADASFASLL